MKRLNWMIVIGMIAVMVALAAACKSSKPQPASTGTAAPATSAATSPAASFAGTVTIGASIGLTGSLAKEGKLTLDGYKFWEQWVNSHGGLKVGDKRYKVDIKYYDDQSDANQSARLMEKLITQDNVKLLLGPYGTPATLQDAVIAERYKIPMVEGNGAAEAIFNKGYKYTFGVLSPAKKYLQGVLEIAQTEKSPAAKTVAIISDNDAFSIEVADGAKAFAEANGLQVVSYEKIPQNTTDVSALITQLKGKNPDILLGSGHFNTSVLLMKTVKDLNLNAKIYGFSVGPSIPDFQKSLGSAADDVFGGTQWTADLKFQDSLFGTAKQYAAEFQKAFGYEPDYHVAESTAACEALQLAIEKAGSLDTTKIRDTLAGLDAMTFYGQIKFDSRGLNIYKPMAVEQWQKGEKVTVWPESAATTKAVYPTPPWSQR